MEVKLTNLTKAFWKNDKKKKANDSDRTLAVDNVNLEIEDGKLIGLLGPSGCGKSTTLYMIAGLHRPTSGRIMFGDRDVTDLPPEKRGIGLVFQNYALYPHLSVEQNIMFPLLSRKEPKDEAKKKAYEMAKLVGIEMLMDRKPSQLSGGQQQRVAIARALVKMPDVLLLDEPLSNLDARLRLQTREEIKRIQRTTGITTIFVTHDQEEAMSISDKIVVMNFGVVQQEGKPQDVYDEPINEFVAKFLGTPPINIIEGSYDGNNINFGDQTFNEDFELDKLNELISSDETKTEEENEEKSNRQVAIHIGIRPEFFNINENGKYEMQVEFIEYIGRDKLLIFKLPGIENKTFKAVIPSSVNVEVNETVKFDITKYFIFDETGRRY